MLSAAELRPGLAVRLEGALYKVLEATYHAGQGKMGGVTHAKLRNLDTGTMREWRFRADEPVEEITPERQTLQFLYRDDDLAYFMHPETFEQTSIEIARLGRAVHFLTETITVPVEFVGGQPIGIVFPEIADARVADTAPPEHGSGTNVWKSARLENGLAVMVPPFIAPGEIIRVDVERGTYVERARKR
ncbi:MAG: elongation factor P [Acidobacteria bacterium]|nr:elongation factor P [Acidobacteriota bacterium]